MYISDPSKPPSNGSRIFWGEVAPCDHVVQLYEDDDIFLDSLEGFVSGGLLAGDGVIVIATPAHAASLAGRLIGRGIDLAAAKATDQYIELDAVDTLDKFMVGGWPDEDEFRRFVLQTLQRAGAGGRRIRAFGEMVAVLWSQGNNGATVRLEHLWQRLCREEAFSLFCAYPKSGFTRDAQASIREICEAHTRVAS
jgi:hypothetical protein